MPKCACKSCPLEAVEDQEYCILHIENGKKNEMLFQERLITYYSTRPHEPVFDNIHFPENINLSEFLRPRQRVINELKFDNCTFYSDLKFNNLELKTVLFHACSCPQLIISNCNIVHLEMADNNIDKFEFDNSLFNQLTFHTWIKAGEAGPSTRQLFMILVKIQLLEIYNFNIRYFHLSGSEIDECRIRNISSREILIRDTQFISRSNIDLVNASKYFLLCRCLILNPKLFTIKSSNLINSGFKATNISEINFIDNTWKQVSQRHIELIDQKIAQSKISLDYIRGPYGGVSLNECAEIYTQLKKNFEAKGNYIDAGNFHYGEMEMRRLSSKSKFSIYLFYKILSDYGESPKRAFNVFTFVFTILVLFHLNQGFYVDSSHVQYKLDLSQRATSFPSFNDIASSIKLTFGHLTLRILNTIRPFDSFTNSIVWTFESIFGPLQIGLIALSIRRKVRR